MSKEEIIKFKSESLEITYFTLKKVTMMKLMVTLGLRKDQEN